MLHGTGPGVGMHGSSMEEVNALRKALTAGDDVNDPGVGPGVGFPLRVEDLSHMMRNTSFDESHIELFKLIQRNGSINSVFEYNQLLAHGDLEQGAFMAEGALPGESDSTYERKTGKIKYMGTTRVVSHQISLLQTQGGPAVTRSAVEGTRFMLRRIEKALFDGDSTLDPLQIDGLNRLIRDGAPTNVVDLRGKPLSESNLQDAVLRAYDEPSYGSPSHLFVSPKNLTDLDKSFFARHRKEMGSEGGIVGGDIRGFRSQAGTVKFVGDTFLNDGGGSAGLSAGGPAAERPGSPTISSAPVTGAAGGSKFVAADVGSYFYSVIAVNARGQSAPVAVAGAVAVAIGEGVTIGITPDGGAPLPTYYKIYRTPKGGAVGTERLILKVANGAGAGEQLIVDLNDKLPGTTEAYLLEMTPANIEIRQLAPLMKMELARIDTSIRFMLLYYFALQLSLPRHNTLIVNVGRDPDAVGTP